MLETIWHCYSYLYLKEIHNDNSKKGNFELCLVHGSFDRTEMKHIEKYSSEKLIFYQVEQEGKKSFLNKFCMATLSLHLDGSEISS